jgi:hypothetical protein
MKAPNCSVDGCTTPAEVEVILYDVYLADLREVYFQRDRTCPYLCAEHMAENEAGCVGERKPRGRTVYPFTNRNGAQGFTIYRPLYAY